MPSPSHILQVQGHRGAMAFMPPNTLPSFQAAIEAGADTLELDLLVTKDLEVVIHHDFFINKDLSTYLDGSPIEENILVLDLPLAKIKTIDVGGKTDPNYPKQRLCPKTLIPTLAELLTWIKESHLPQAQKIRLNLEIKRDPRSPHWTKSPKELANLIVDLVEKHNFSDRVYYSSFDPETLSAIRTKNPSAELGFIFDATSLSMAFPSDPQKGLELLMQMATALQVKTLSPDHTLLGQLFNIANLHTHGFQVIPWAVNETARWQELLNMGVDGLITDDPKGLLVWLEKQKPSTHFSHETV